MSRIERLAQTLQEVLGEKALEVLVDRGEVTLRVSAADYPVVAELLRDHPDLAFEQLIDLSGLDYSGYGNRPWPGPRFAVAVHLLSLQHNVRLRLKTFAEDDEFPMLPSLIEVWPSVDWYEREAFDLFGILFEGHPDLRRILTDYGFVGHPLRKDFPVSGHVEMRYDPHLRRVIYQPVTIEPRVNAPRIVREAHYGDVDHG
ncbi:MAG: NADH-quinone oxidoreductase subunit C [Tepidiphilus sp.]|jgi:NADH-quinone oxidoreductase subunit C|uniref:NADH-quinone oxidoreductase subunit C n=1 Tax=Tepidiphilus thermophilus TaxID=876478 RepID=A0A0K6IVT2_9PROT|nr:MULTISPECIES: NADH-quinone oxidoreductase subunit C [Tepidiphilus]MBP6998873.1 NADH-quinone oxidoreductase subunit C [Tepidiphilus sp.]MDK2796475.1 NADH-quinone oxidoreductase subunit [Tepidiphilus sp.]CUB07226.1 NADH dehydrogenase subunit C [Tepidiphilus thermophilus]